MLDLRPSGSQTATNTEGCSVLFCLFGNPHGSSSNVNTPFIRSTSFLLKRGKKSPLFSSIDHIKAQQERSKRPCKQAATVTYIGLCPVTTRGLTEKNGLMLPVVGGSIRAELTATENLQAS